MLTDTPQGPGQPRSRGYPAPTAHGAPVERPLRPRLTPRPASRSRVPMGARLDGSFSQAEDHQPREPRRATLVQEGEAPVGLQDRREGAGQHSA